MSSVSRRRRTRSPFSELASMWGRLSGASAACRIHMAPSEARGEGAGEGKVIVTVSEDEVDDWAAVPPDSGEEGAAAGDKTDDDEGGSPTDDGIVSGVEGGAGVAVLDARGIDGETEDDVGKTNVVSNVDDEEACDETGSDWVSPVTAVIVTGTLVCDVALFVVDMVVPVEEMEEVTIEAADCDKDSVVVVVEVLAAVVVVTAAAPVPALL